MSDNVTIPTSGTGDTTPVIAADDIGGVKHQRVKVEWGADGAANDTSAANPLPVVQTGTPGLPTGAATSTNQSTEQTLIGAVTETAPLTDTASSGLNGRLQRVAQRLTSLIALLPTSLGQKTMANGLAVTIASDQSAVPVSGTVTASGSLTDEELRDTPVPVSGTVTASGPLTDTQLRASAVPVSGTVTVTGALTDAQLRATPVPVSGASGGGPATIADGADVATGTTSDAAWISGAGTVIALLKKIATAGGSAVSVADGADVAQGTTSDAASASTVVGLLKNLKAALAGTLTVGGSVTATGPVTDTELRATAVPVSLAALPALAAGTANIGDVDLVGPSLGTGTPTGFTATTSTAIFTSRATAKLRTFANDSDKDLYLILRAAAVSIASTGYHVKVPALGGFFSTDYTGEVRGIMSATITTGQVNCGEFD